MEIQIKRATNKDIAAIGSLNTHVQEIHHQAHPDIFKPPADDENSQHFFEYLFSRDSNRFYIAFLNSIPVGYLWYAIEEKPDFPMKFARKQIMVHQVAVHQTYRKLSIGRSLFEQMEKDAKKANIRHIELDTWHFNKSAHVFFRKMGFDVYSVNMWKKS